MKTLCEIRNALVSIALIIALLVGVAGIVLFVYGLYQMFYLLGG
jgi:hypothetical protein